MKTNYEAASVCCVPKDSGPYILSQLFLRYLVRFSLFLLNLPSRFLLLFLLFNFSSSYSYTLFCYFLVISFSSFVVVDIIPSFLHSNALHYTLISLAYIRVAVHTTRKSYSHSIPTFLIPVIILTIMQSLQSLTTQLETRYIVNQTTTTIIII